MRFLITSIFFISTLLGYAQDQYNFLNLSLEDGLSQITVTTIYQDKKGFIWFGTRNGLNKYDGYEFKVYKNRSEDERSLSDNHILCIDEDNKNNLWIGTNNGLNKLNLSTGKITRFIANISGDNSLLHNMILAVLVDDNNLWIGTNGGLNLYDIENEKLTTINLDGIFTDNPIHKIVKKDDILYIATQKSGIVIYDCKKRNYKLLNVQSGLPSNYIKSLYVDDDNSLWIGTHHHGVWVRKKNKEGFSTYSENSGLSNNYVRCIAESPEGNILIGTFNGLNIIDKDTEKIVEYNSDITGNEGLSHYSVYSILFDRSRTLWVGTYAGGIDYYNPYGQKFRFHNPYVNKSIKGIVGPIQEVGRYLYIASEGSGLIEFDKQTREYTNYMLQGGSNVSGQNILKVICQDGDRLLCGTNRGTIYSFDLKLKKFSLFYTFKEEQSIYHISRNSQGDIVVGGVNSIGFSIIKQNNQIQNKFLTDTKEEISFWDVRCIYEVEPNMYLIGTRNNGLFIYELKNRKLLNFTNEHTSEKGAHILENYISSIIKDKKGKIWLGTYGGGICEFDIRTHKLINYGEGQGLADNNICAIVEGYNSHLWISTLSGISDFDTKTLTFENYMHSSGIKVNEFTPHAGLKLSNDLIAFSGNNGFITFNPRQMSLNPYIPPVVLKNLYINNKVVIFETKDSPLKKQLDEEKEIILNYNQTNIAIEFSALNYIYPNKNQYTYIMEGFDDSWNEIGSRRTAYYTNIPPGKYKFIVKGSNNDGLWNDEGKELQITILPPPWKTWWAYTLYFLVIVAIAVITIRYFNKKKWLENEVKLKQAENKAQEEFHQARNKLFANFSHELRTPLTLILSPLEDMLQHSETFSAKMKDNLELMYSNGKRLLRLVNNLMDFQKKENGKLELKISKDNFVKFSRDMMYLFNELSESRKISLQFQSNTNNINYFFDKYLMEKVYFNFLSNAFKNTPNNGLISLIVNLYSYEQILDSVPLEKVGSFIDRIQYIYVEIKDSGVGLHESELEKIFIPFYQVAQNEHSSSGTGLGLTLSRSIVEMHHGIIWAESVNGEGATFKIVFPIDGSLLTEYQIVESEVENEKLIYEVECLQDEIINDEDLSPRKYTILVTEDNNDVRKYIISHLADDYHIIEASNGKDALDKAFSTLPDLVISDLMMPRMDGMEMTSMLKEDIRTSHIPVILLTARTMNEDIMEGYKTGADDYITKPFNSQVLKSRVKNILKSRENLKEIYSQRFKLDTLGVKTTSVDDVFIQKLYQILEKELSNSEFSQDTLSLEIGMSKTALYRKIKSITNLSPSEFIRNYRLEMGAKLIKDTELPISEIYVLVGFNSHTYFSTSFKALFGVTPSEYVSQCSSDNC